MRQPRFVLAPLTLAALVAASLSGPTQALAQAQPSAASALMSITIAAQPLGQALNELARQAGLQLLFPPALVAGKTAPAVSGTLTPGQAVDRLLAGSGLIATREGNAVVIRAAPPAEGGATLAPVTVTGQAERTTPYDPGSYTTREVQLFKGASLRETPYSVGIITRQQMDDQNITTIKEALAQATGINEQVRGWGRDGVMIRGFNPEFSVDGVPGTSASLSNRWSADDMATYEQVEVLRGAAGMILGRGNPGGLINMVRKRGGYEPKVGYALQVDSWGSKRAELDAGGPLNAAGTLRGRTVLAYQDRHEFWDRQQSDTPLVYGVVDADVGPATTLSAGLSWRKRDTENYWIGSQPQYKDSRLEMNLPRSTSFAPPSSYANSEVREVFAEARHRFGKDWELKFSATRSQELLDNNLFMVVDQGRTGTIIEQGSSGWVDANANAYANKSKTTRTGLTAGLNGSFDAFGKTHQLMLNADWRRENLNYSKYSDVYQTFPINLYAFNPYSVSALSPDYVDYTTDNPVVTDYGVSAALRLRLADPLTLVAGGRLSWTNWEKRQGATSEPAPNVNAEFTPHAGILFDINKNWTAYASYADIFQPQTGYRTVSGGYLNPVLGANYELGIKGELFDKKLNVSAALFRIKEFDYAEEDKANQGRCPQWDTLGACYKNGGDTRYTQGLDLEASGQIAPGWQASAGYTYSHFSYASGAELPDEGWFGYRHLFRVYTSYRLPGDWQRLTVGGGVQVKSGVKISSSNGIVPYWNGGKKYNDERLVNVFANYKINDKTSIALNVSNLFDQKYYTTIGYYGAPRKVSVTLRGEF